MSSDQNQLSDPILAMLPPVKGRHILKPCVLYARLGSGGMGAVYLAKHLTLMQKQVVKCLWLARGGNPGDGAFVDRFQQEARIAAEMTHQNLVRVTHVDRVGDLHYLVMEYVEGEDLERRVARSGPMNEEAALTALLGAAQGLGYAHARGIVHRDVKPANLMLSTHGEVKVIDLGLARAMDTTRQLGATIGVIGTPLYMAPEQWEGASVEPSADVWALGAVLYFMLTGETIVPADTSNSNSIRKLVTSKQFAEASIAKLRVSRDAKRVLRQCLATDPISRYSDARDLAADLAGMIVGDERLLAAHGELPPVQGDEPSDDELRMLQGVLANQDIATREQSVGPQAMLARTVIQQLPDAHGGNNRKEAKNHDTAQQTPFAALRPSRPQIRRRRSSPVSMISAAVGVLLFCMAGVVMWPSTDYDAIQQEAMAAIYQERFADADRLLTILEEAPSFADQARRLRIDALLKDAKLLGTGECFEALQRLATAEAVAHKLLITHDSADAVTRVGAAREPFLQFLRDAMGASLSVKSPVRDEVITQGRQQVLAHFTPGKLPLRVTIQGRAMEMGSDGSCRGEWYVPETDGITNLQVVVEEPTTKMRHVVEVEVMVRRGAVALHIEAPTVATSSGQPELSATIDHGPVAVSARITSPDGIVTMLSLGERNGAFRFTIPGKDGLDGSYSVRLEALLDEQELTSPECSVLIDRQAPKISMDDDVRHCSEQTLLLRGTADEGCQVFVVGNETVSVATDGNRGFALQVNLPSVEGASTITLGVRDVAGNTDLRASVIRVQVDRRAPNFIKGSLQHELATAGDSIRIAGRIDEVGRVSADDGAAIETDDEGMFQLLARLPSGEIEQPVQIRLLARDLAGNVTTPATVAVFVDRRGPRILPGAADGSWWDGGYWVFRLEDHSKPCRVTMGSESQAVGPDGTVRFIRRATASGVVVTAHDQLGNDSTRTLSGPGVADVHAIPDVGPSWGTPVAGSVIDPQLSLYERVSLSIGDESIVMRLVRALREDELPPVAQRDARAVALLQGQEPFYLAETEVPTAAWRAYCVVNQNATAAARGYQFDPATCQWSRDHGGDWQTPLHATLAGNATEAQRARWPVTQVTPKDVRGFCDQFQVRLPTDSEWRYVVRMGTRGRYGWGARAPLEQRANLADLQLAALAPKLRAFDTVEDGFAGLAPVDAFPHASQAHPWGFRNLLGNAAEWCTTTGDRVVARGGSWLSEPRDLRVDNIRQERAITSGAWDCVGFRIARDR